MTKQTQNEQIQIGDRVHCKTGYTGVIVLCEVLGYDALSGDPCTGMGRWQLKVIESNSPLVPAGCVRIAHPSAVYKA